VQLYLVKIDIWIYRVYQNSTAKLQERTPHIERRKQVYDNMGPEMHNYRLSQTRSIPYWTTSVCSSSATNDERRLTAHTLNSYDCRFIELSWNELISRRTEYRLSSPTVRVLVCFIGYHRNVCLVSRWITVKFFVATGTCGTKPLPSNSHIIHNTLIFHNCINIVWSDAVVIIHY
jgi:hypothetical protein